MAAHYADNVLHGPDHPDTHASQTRWRHQESSAFLRHASVTPREADQRTDSKDLANFLNSARIDPPETDGKPGSPGKHQPLMVAGNIPHENGVQTSSAQHEGPPNEAIVQGHTTALEVKCGPLLNYRRMEDNTWFGSVLVVTRFGGSGESPVTPQLTVKIVGTRSSSGAAGKYEIPAASSGGNVGANGQDAVVNGVDYGSFNTPTATENPNGQSFPQSNANGAPWKAAVNGTILYSDPSNTFWRFDLKVPMQQSEIECVYTISGLNFTKGRKTDKQSFFIPAITESMRIMFHSCNGFSVGTDEEAWSGPCLWNDVNRVHKVTPFHVMLGGGDQIYNDGIRVNGPLRPWTDIGNPKKRREFPFPESLRRDCDEYYVNNYLKWYGQEPFASANGQIAQLNLWDDHDIIDGFGSYVDEFMRCPVFRGIGGVANKYYLLFQHHLAPPPSTYTTGKITSVNDSKYAANHRQMLPKPLVSKESVLILDNSKTRLF